MPKTAVASEYIKVPRGCDPDEIWAPEGAPLSPSLLDALRLRPAASAALLSAPRVVWGAPLPYTRYSHPPVTPQPPPHALGPHPPAGVLTPRSAPPAVWSSRN